MVILEACFEAGDICPLKEFGDAEAVLKALNTALEKWVPTPDPARDGESWQVATVKTQLVKPMYDQSAYMGLAEFIKGLLTMTPAEVIAAVNKGPAGAETDKPKPESWHKSDELNLYAIRCGDWPLRATEPSEMAGIIEMLDMGSFADASASDWMACYSWPFMAKEQYEGSFSAQTKTPVLYVNPTWDPVTPLASAKNSSSTLEGSVVLEQRTTGHSVFASPNSCSLKYMRDYMVEGTLPKEGTVCENEFPTFSAMNLSDRILATNKIYKEIIIDSNGVDVEELAAQARAAAGGGNGTSATGANGASANEEKNSGASSLTMSLVAAFVGVVAYMATV